MPDTNPSSAPILSLQGVGKRFGGLKALDDVGFQVRPGEAIGLLGENGAGKSTLIKILAGVYSRDAGTILLDGKPIEEAHDEARPAIAFIHQDLGLIDWMTVAENVALATGFARRFGLVDWAETRRRAAAALVRLGCAIPPDRRISMLTQAERALVAIARALAVDARILVLDEPTASLPSSDVEHLLAVLREVRRSGVALIYISHRLEEVEALCDRVVILRDGRLVADRPTRELAAGDVVRLIMGGVDLEPPTTTRATPGAVRLALEGVVAGPAGPLDFTIRAGEILGLVGLRGAGHEAVSRALIGLVPVTVGRVLLDGKAPDLSSPAAAIAAGIGFVAANRVEESVARGMSVAENLLLSPAIDGRAPLGLTAAGAEAAEVGAALSRFDVRPAAPEAEIEALSGGNQQKVVLARWLRHPRPLLVLEEPTAGIDVGAKAQVHRLLHEAAASGTAILVVSTDYEEVASLCDRTLVFRRGRIVAEQASPTMTKHSLFAAASAVAA